MKETDNKQTNKSKSYDKLSQIEEFISEFCELRFNIVSNTTEFCRKGENIFQPIDERIKATMRLEMGRRNLSGVKTYFEDILNSDHVPIFNPFEAYFRSLPKWQIGDRDWISDLCSFIKVKENSNPEERRWFAQMLRNHLLRTVSCALRKIEFNKHCFVFLGKQNDGKSFFVRWLTPPQLIDYYKENPQLDHKDSVIALSQNLIINLDELHDMNKVDANKVKSLFSQSDTKVRHHYGKYDTLQKRYASFFGTTNDSEFLNDVTGNVRWIVFEIQEILHDGGREKGYSANIPIDNVWSQAYALVLQGHTGELTKEEIARVEKNNLAYQKRTTEIDLIERYLTPANTKDKLAFPVTASDVTLALNKVTNNAFRLNHVQIGKALTFLGFQKSAVRLNGKNPTHRFFVKTNDPIISESLLSNVGYIATNIDSPPQLEFHKPYM